MSLKSKAAAAALALGDLDSAVAAPSPAAAPVPAPAAPQAVPTGLPSSGKARSGVASITESINQQHKLLDLEQKVADYEKAGVVVQLDPATVSQGPFKNRHELSYKTAEFASLRTDIANAGGNVQPILVRPNTVGDLAYEVVYGRRRLRACLELGIPVRAIVATMSTMEAFQAMDRENRERANLSAWEQGVMYKDALDQGLFPSIRRMAAALDVDPTNLSRATRLAALPLEIIDAFPSPLEIQFRWIAPLCDAFDRNSAKVLSAAAVFNAMSPRPPSKVVFDKLSSPDDKVDAVQPVRREFQLKGKSVASWVKDRKGNVSVSIKAGSLSGASEKKLLETLERVFQER